MVARVMPRLDTPSESPFSDLSAGLIEHNYRELGCDGWNRPRFQRLCGKLQRTLREMAALMRLKMPELRKRLETGFTGQDGLILTLLEREIDAINTGRLPTRGVFMMVSLQKSTEGKS